MDLHMALSGHATMSGTRYRSGSVGTGNTRSSPGTTSPIWSAASSESTAPTTATDFERVRHSRAYGGGDKRHAYDADASASIDSALDPSDSDSVSSTSADEEAPPEPTLRLHSADNSRASLSSPASSLEESSDEGHGDAQVHVPARRPGQPVFEGFWQVRSLDDLRPLVDSSGMMASQRRADPAGGHVSPLKALTSYLHHTYHLANPAFFYELAFNPRRVLTKPSKPMYNDGYDNEDSDYILYVNDWLGSEEGNRYLILDVLGQGTFGQVVKCQNMATHEIVAVKVIKNKTAYFNQSMMEVTILETLNQHWDADDAHNILRLHDTFIHRKHLCLVFELLSSNLYELIKQNSFRGLSTSLVRVFTTQLLDALTVLKEARLIHCDLKPENILLRTLQTPSIKLVDFGSACHEQQTVYTYIQSRFYRSPEVLLGLPYTASIDMWSLGCIAVELFLGLPIFPGTSEYNQLSRIVDMLGMPPQFMLDAGKQTREFFNVHDDAFGRTSYRFKSREQYSREHNVQEQPSKQYFPGTTLPEIIRLAPVSRRSGRAADVDKEMANRTAFIDFVAGLLNINPLERWSPQQAKLHPFITGEPFTQPWQPPPAAETPAPVPEPEPEPAPEPAPAPAPTRRPGRPSRSSTITAADVAAQRTYSHGAAPNTQDVHAPPSVLPASASAYAPPLTRHSYAPPDDFQLPMHPVGYYPDVDKYYGVQSGVNVGGVSSSVSMSQISSMQNLGGVPSVPVHRMSVAGTQPSYPVYPSVGSSGAVANAAQPTTAGVGASSWNWTASPPQLDSNYRTHAPGGFAVVVHGNEQYAMPAEMPPSASQYDVYGLPPRFDGGDALSPPTANDQYARRRYSSAPQNMQNMYDHRDPGVLPLYVHRAPGS